MVMAEGTTVGDICHGAYSHRGMHFQNGYSLQSCLNSSLVIFIRHLLCYCLCDSWLLLLPSPPHAWTTEPSCSNKISKPFATKLLPSSLLTFVLKQELTGHELMIPLPQLPRQLG